jgi:hypothetical protein
MEVHMKHRQLAKSVLATFLVAQFSGSPAWAGLFGVAAGQAIRVSVVNAGGTINPCFTPPLLVPEIRIRDVSGKPVFESKGRLLQEEEGMFLDVAFPPDPIRRLYPPRAQVRAEVVLELDTATKRCNDIVLTLEVFDTATGRTAFTMPFTAVGFNPQPEPPETSGQAE